MTVAVYQSLLQSARSALAAGSYDAAVSYAVQAKAALAEVLDQERALGAGAGSMVLSTRNSLAQIDSFIADCRRLKQSAGSTSSGPFQQTRVVYERAATSDAYQ